MATSSISSSRRPDPAGVEPRLAETLTWLKRSGTKANRDGMARYAIRSEHVFGVSVGTLRGRAKPLGRDHDLAAALWETGWYEARMLAAFALLASLAAHDRESGDEPFLRCLPLIERESTDERNFVKKAASWALRTVGERSLALHATAERLARKLAASPDKTARWIGKDALRQFASPATARRLAAKAKRRASRERGQRR